MVKAGAGTQFMLRVQWQPKIGRTAFTARTGAAGGSVAGGLMDKSDWFGRRWERRSTTARANARMACKSGAWGHNIVSDVEKTAGFSAWARVVARSLTGRASSDTFMIREKGVWNSYTQHSYFG